ncbi:hypothetical protein OG563_26780 [Nocardia vinacea]|uniref:PPM-type phosphatase domain-containing protein n=1 Tax=Nocardia vinacea TaxID=96468 RepID=A0ABZ1YHZ5_9NOCA|nr:hypothetical protein [Nocardia vinacea]
MSEMLSAAAELTAAIRRYVSVETGGELATDWLLFTAHTGTPNPDYLLAVSDGLSPHAAGGLSMRLPGALEERYDS